MSEKWGMAAFVGSAMVLAGFAGMAAARNDWFPNPQVTLVVETVRELRAHWKNDLALEPTRHLVPARAPGEGKGFEGLRVHRPGAATPGYTLVAGLSPDQERSAFEVALYDATGKRLHAWPVDYAALDPEGPEPLHVMLHGMEVFPDGSLAVAFDAGRAIARIDACGTPLWTRQGGYHHAITADEAGGLWAWRDETIVRLDAETGAETRRLDLRKDVLPAAGGQEGALSIRSFIDGGSDPLRYDSDAFHANDVEPLLPGMAAAFPGFEAGDLLVSLRELNLVAVLDPDDGRLKWWQHGPWLKQHDPDFQPDGTITVFDNHSGSDASRILSIDPGSREVRVLFAGSAETPFYSWQRGKHQVLPGGNLLLTESEHGRVLEVAPDGTVIWERDRGWDAERNMVVTEARHLPPDFFPDGPPACMVTASL
jgi:hypothetical protein